MNTCVLTSLKSAGCILAAAAALATSGFAQQTAPKGSFVYTESGIETTTLANLSFANDGTVTGTEIVQQTGPVATYAMQGVYTANDDGSKTLSLTGTSVDMLDANGNPLVVNEILKVIALPSGSFVTLGTDPGQYSRGYLIPATATIAPGEYLVNGKPIDPAATSVEVVVLDAAGNVSGQEVVNSFGLTTQRALSGSYTAGATGFITLGVNATFTDADGNTQTVSETYLALPTVKDIRALRTDAPGNGLLNLVK